MTGAFGLTTLSLTATFAAIMLPPRLFASHEALVIAAIAYFSVTLIADYGVAIALAKTTVLLIACVGVPCCVQFWMAFLSHDAALSLTDPMCHVLNRRGFLRAAVEQIGHTEPHREMAAIVFDIDNYKSINDTYGHAAGDRVLATVAHVAGDYAAGAGGLIGRIGGDEFAILAPVGTPGSHVDLAESIRRTISLTGEIRVTVSVGIAVESISDPSSAFESINRLLGNADTAMYQSKNARNCVTCFPDATLQ